MKCHLHLVEQLHLLPAVHPQLPPDAMAKNANDFNAIRAQTDRLSWQQHLGRPSNDCLCTAHEFIDRAPKFKHFDPVLEKHLTCIWSKQTKEPAGLNSMQKATCPF